MQPKSVIAVIAKQANLFYEQIILAKKKPLKHSSRIPPATVDMGVFVGVSVQRDLCAERALLREVSA